MNHEVYMQRCIDLAKNGEGNTSPNPMVGAVIVHNGTVIGEGWHQQYGKAHAEVNAVNSVKNKEALKDSTIYVSLEPCAHFGKTPPCADLIVKHQFKEVVIGCRDPFESVNGKGIEKIEAAGIKTTVGVLEKECQDLNKFFFTFHTKKRPYIILKWAETRDGFIDSIRDANKKGVNWITQKETKVLVHKWRSEADSILVGKNTVLNDDPELTTRAYKGKNPARLIIAPNGDIPTSTKIFNNEASTWVFTDKEVSFEKSDLQVKIDFSSNPLEQIMEFCYTQNLQSILVEGGANTLQSFINANLWDEKRVLEGISEFQNGLKAPSKEGMLIESIRIGKDTLKRISP